MAITNLESNIYTGTTTFAFTDRRQYFMLYAVDADATVSFGNGNGALPIYTGGFYEPLRVPMSEFTVTTTGSFIFLSDMQETV